MKPIAVEFPLRGEWTAPTTPGYKIPSHGTDVLGMTYAYDFVRLDWERNGKHLHTKGLSRYLFSNVELKYCPGWRQKIYSPFDGKVVEVINNIRDHNGLNIFKDLGRVLINEISMKSNLNSYEKYVGNYIVIEGESCYAALAHERCGSIEVREGQTVKAGQYLAEVGHSGNSTAPHLHFQLMDHHDVTRAKGVACCFKAYEVLRNGVWEIVLNGIPQRWERIRVINA